MDAISKEILKCQDQWYSLLGPLERLKYCSIALADGNVRQIRLPNNVEPSLLVEEIYTFIQKKKAKWDDLRYWAIHPDYRNKQLEEFLTSIGLKPNVEIGMVLGTMISLITNFAVKIEDGLEVLKEWEQIQVVKYENESEVENLDIPKLLKEHRKKFRNAKVEIYVAKLHDKLAGRITLFTCGRTAQLDEIYTIPKFRRKHVASTLMSFVTGIVKKRGIENIIVVVPKTLASYDMYKKFGFLEKVKLMGYYR